VRDRVLLTGLSDHFVSEALYLDDPDGHGIEIYWDRPREVWQGQVAERMTTLRLDVESLLGELEDPASAPFDGLPPGTTMGHIHLKVGDIPASVGFYRRAWAARAAFFGAARQATLVLPDAIARDAVLKRLERAGHLTDGDSRVQDPSGNRLLLDVASAR
jgi:catechol 2,3-dioxygenase